MDKRNTIALILALALPVAAQAVPRSPVTIEVSTGANASGLVLLSWEADRPLLPSPGFGLGAALSANIGGWFVGRVGVDYQHYGSSPFDQNLFQYRAFYGGRLSLLCGFRLPAGPALITLMGGAALSASEYDQTSLVTASPSALLEPGIELPLGLAWLPPTRVTIGLPLECLFRGATTSVSAGFTLGVTFQVKKVVLK